MDELMKAYNEAWVKAPLVSRIVTIIETDVIISAFNCEATTENNAVAHRIAVRTAKRIIEEIKKEK